MSIVVEKNNKNIVGQLYKKKYCKTKVDLTPLHGFDTARYDQINSNRIFTDLLKYNNMVRHISNRFLQLMCYGILCMLLRHFNLYLVRERAHARARNRHTI